MATSLGIIPESLKIGELFSVNAGPALPIMLFGRRALYDELIWDAEGGFADGWQALSSLELQGSDYVFILGRRAYSGAGLALFSAGALTGDAGGDIVGPGGATDMGIARYDGTTGKLLQDSLVVVTDTGSIELPALQLVDGRDISVDGAMLDTLDTLKADKSINITAGSGLVGGGDLSTHRSLDVVAHADGSIVVNPSDVQVGVLATDAQHGVRGGGTQHANATTSVAGFASAADKVLIDGSVQGPASATDNAVARYNLATGKLVQSSGVLIDDSNNLSGIGSITLTGTVDGVDVSTLGTTVAAVQAVPFVTIGNTGSVANERALTGGIGLTVTDGGAGGAVTLQPIQQVFPLNSALTVDLSYRHSLINYNGAASTTITAPLNATIPLPVGYQVEIFNNSSSALSVLTVAGSVGVTIRQTRYDNVVLVESPLSISYLSKARLLKINTNEWLFEHIRIDGSVQGPASATDNALARFDGTTGKLVQNSAATLDDAGSMLTAAMFTNALSVTGNITVTGTVDGVDVSALSTSTSAVAAVPFVTIGNTASVANERALAATLPVVLTDGGAGGSVTLSAPTAVVGPASATNNAIAVYDGTTGKLIKNSSGTTTDGSNLYVSAAVLAANVSASSTVSAAAVSVTGNITVTGTVDGVDVSSLSTSTSAVAAVPFVTIGNTASVANERALAVGYGLQLTDGGAGGSVTLNAKESMSPTTIGDTVHDGYSGGFVLYTGASSATWNLPASVSAGVTFKIFNSTSVGASVVNLTPTGGAQLRCVGDTIGSPNQLVQYEHAVVTKLNTTYWLIVGFPFAGTVV